MSTVSTPLFFLQLHWKLVRATALFLLGSITWSLVVFSLNRKQLIISILHAIQALASSSGICC
jgi:hypothetical protein